MHGLTRTQFLRGEWDDPRAVIRPPWSAGEETFRAQCDGCGDCVARCPTHILRMGRDGFPAVDFSAGACTFCGDCVVACKPGALACDDEHAPWQLQAHIGPDCLALNRVVCRVCAEHCETHAIRFRLAPGGVAVPELRSERCTGCGACVAVCPTSAITVEAPAALSIEEAA